MAERRSCSAKPRFLFRYFGTMRSFALSLFTIVSGVLVATPSRAITIEVVSPSAEVVFPPDNSLYNIYPLTSVNVGGAGKASVTLKAIYEVGEKDDILIQEIATMFLDAINTNVETPFTITKTSEIMRSIKNLSTSAALGIGDHTAKMSYKLSTFNFKVDMENPNLFHSIPSGPSGPVPITLLDISDVHKFKIISSPVPGPLPLLGVGAAFGYSRKLRKRIKGRTSRDVASAID